MTRRSIGGRRRSASHGEAGYVRRDLDAYMTEPWVTRALVQAIHFADPVWEPACGTGSMVTELRSAGYSVIASDIHNYGFPGTIIHDFLRDPPPFVGVHSVVTNSPFGAKSRV